VRLNFEPDHRSPREQVHQSCRASETRADIDEDVRTSHRSLFNDPQQGIDRTRYVLDAAPRQLGAVIRKVAEAKHDIEPPVANRWRDTQ